MAFKNLERFEAARREAEHAEQEREAQRELRRVVRAAIPKNVRMPKRPRGRTSVGGVTRKEVAALRADATLQLDGEVGLRKMEAEVRHTALVILKIDGLLGTEPWRASSGPHGALVSANARLRYLENAARLLDDLRRSLGGSVNKLIDGIIVDAERVGESR